MIEFAHPEAFLLLPLWGLGGWWLPRAALWRPLRAGVMLLLLMAWADPMLNRTSPGLDLWVLQDLSLSAQEQVRPGMAELEPLLQQGMGPEDEIFFVDFAEEAVLRDPLAAAVLGGRKDSSRIGNALQYSLSRMRQNRNARLLLVSDGFSTEPLDQTAERLLQEGVPLDLRLTLSESGEDLRVQAVEAPLRVGRGEPFLVEARLRGPSGAGAEVKLLRDGIELNRQQISFQRGEARVKWTVRMEKAGSAKFEVRIAGERDRFVENNRQIHWVEAGGSSRVLLLSAYVDDPLAGRLRDAGEEVEHLTDFSRLGPGSLSGVGLLWIHNVHAADLPESFLQQIPFYVMEQGGGLIMAGGKSSFGSGGYFDSPVDPLLPVSMELKEEDRKLTVAIAIVMDRSGSMSAMGNGGMSKMELANAGAARAIELMGEMDSVTVFAVDTEAHEILPLRQVGRQRERLTSLVRRIQSNGGGIYVFNGLEAAWKQLRNAPQPRRHVILFADAADAEQPEGVDGLIKEMIQKQTTVSVIALGQESDADAPFLEQIAEDGQGRLFFNQDAATLPAVFAQETVSVSRSAFLEDQTAAEPLAGWQELAAGALDWPPQVDGYNLSYLREGAAESLRTLDRYAAPLLAHWQRGAGRVVAVSMPLGGPFSQGMRDWSEYGDFVRTLSRWSMRGEMPSGLALRLHRVGEVLQVKLYADASWQEEFALQPPELRMISTLEDGVQHQAWRRIRPGLLQTEIPLRASERVQGAIRIGKEVLPFGPVNGMAGAEWEMNPRMRRQLQLLSAQSGGETRTDLAEIWNSPPRRNLQGTGKFWLTAGFLLFLVEAVWSRLAGHPLRFGFQWKRGRRERTSGNALKKPEPSPNNVAAAAVRRRSAFQKAKSPGRRSGSRYGQEKPG